jgi:TrmH family RNA methyltransferase
VARAESLDGLPGRKVALVPARGTPLEQVDIGSEVTLLIGAEREGLPEEAVQASDEVAHIPISTHSLNAAMAATIGLYELAHRIRP